MRFLVVGAGSWGTAFTRVLLDREHDVVLACRTPEQAEAIASAGWNPRYLQSVDLSAAEAVPLADASGDVDVVVVAVPSRAFVEVVDRLPGDAPVLSLVKGLDPETGERLSTRVRGRSVAVLSGPNIAEEIAAGLPTAAVIASNDASLAGQLQHALSSSLFRAYVNPDVVGVELCAAAKNVIALAAGGDLVVTCCSAKTRNRHAGELIAQGLTPEQAVAEIGQTVEGLTTAPVLRDLSHRLGVELPVTEGVCAVLSGRSITDLAAGLMGREPTEE
jgi:glycerol-3-phosphate dehydrogenase (NAD(P)+)